MVWIPIFAGQIDVRKCGEMGAGVQWWWWMARRTTVSPTVAVTPSNFAPRRLSPSSRAALLRSILEAAGRRFGEAPPVVVFDLDGTLLDNRPRVVRIFHELADAWNEAHPDASAILRTTRDEHIGYGVGENLARLGIDDASLQAAGLDFWKERFFYDAYMKYDVEVPGAAAFVRACYEAGAAIVYLTGRDLPNMALGTFGSLRDLGFPIGVVASTLVTKPVFEMPDTDFKRALAPTFSRVGHVIASFDNEPANVNLFHEFHPHAHGVFVDTQHAPDPPELDDRASVIDSFEIDG